MGWRSKCNRFKIAYVVGFLFSVINAAGVTYEIFRSVDIVTGGFFLVTTTILIGMYLALTYFIFKQLLPMYMYVRRKGYSVRDIIRDNEENRS